MNELVMNGSSRKRRPKPGDVVSLDRDCDGRPVGAALFAQYLGDNEERSHIVAVFEPIRAKQADTVRVSELSFALYAFTDLGFGIRRGDARIVGTHALLVPPPSQVRSPAGFAADNRTVTAWIVRPPRRTVKSGDLTAEEARAPIKAFAGVQFAASLALAGWRAEHSTHGFATVPESPRSTTADPGSVSPVVGMDGAQRARGVSASAGEQVSSSTVMTGTGDDSVESSDATTPAHGQGNLSAEQFWQLFVYVDRAKLDAGLEEEALEELTRQLSQLPKSQLIGFEDQLAARLHALDTRAHFEAGFDGGGGPDSFLYQRCYVVARGREYYDRVLADPGQMPDSEEQWCETLLYTASAAWGLQSGGDDWDHVPEISYETGSNASGW